MKSNTAAMVHWARALRTALHDSRAESDSGHESVIYFDDDVIVGTFKSYKDIIAMAHARQLQSLDEDVGGAGVGIVVRTLWATGFACRAHMLSPHRAEFAHVIGREMGRNPPAAGVTRIRMEARRAFRLDLADRLDEVFGKQGPKGHAMLMDLADAIPIQYLALAVASLKDWQSRMRLIGGRLVLDKTPPEELITEEWEQRNAGEIARACLELQRFRTKAEKSGSRWGWWGRASISRNTYVDVRAMCELAAVVRRDGMGVKFYTNTEPLIQFLIGGGSSITHDIIARTESRSDPLDATPTIGKDVAIDHPEGVLRSSAYMLLRSVLEAVAFSSRREPWRQSRETSDDRRLRQPLEELVDAARRLVKPPLTSANQSAVQDERDAWTKFLREVQDSAAVVNVWASKDSGAFEYLREELLNIGSFVEAVKTIGRNEDAIDSAAEANKSWFREELNVNEKRYQSLLSVATKEAEQQQSVQAIIESALAVGGVYRWVGMLHQSGRPYEDERQRVLSALVEHGSGRGLPATASVSDWERVALSESNALDIRLLGACFCWCRGSDVAAKVNLEGMIRRGVASNEIGATAAIASLKRCVDIFNGKIDDKVRAYSDGSAWESIIRGPFVRSARAWKAFYWCHRRMFGRAGGFDGKIEEEVAGWAASAERDLEQDGMAGSDSPITVEPDAVMSRIVEHLLAVISGRIVTEKWDAVGDSAFYMQDALAFAASLRKPGEKETKRLLKSVIEEHRMMQRERYLGNHARWYARCLEEWK